MARQTSLQLVNKVLNNLGESSSLSALTSLTGISLLVFNTLNELLYSIAQEYKYMPLEEDGTITLSTNIGTVALPSDLYDFDPDSFRYNNESKVYYYTPNKFDREYPCQTYTGAVDSLTRWKEYWKLYNTPSSAYNGKTINYRYWKHPTVFSTSSTTGTCWIPEGFDLTLLADYCTYKILHYKQNDEAAVYYAKVFGDGRENEGSYANFKRLYGSPQLLDSSIMAEPM